MLQRLTSLQYSPDTREHACVCTEPTTSHAIAIFINAKITMPTEIMTRITIVISAKMAYKFNNIYLFFAYRLAPDSGMCTVYNGSSDK